MKKFFIIILTLALHCISATVAFGLPFQLYNPVASRYGARVAGMGGAFTAVADDGFAPYYNPAGMTQLKACAVIFDIGGSTLIDPYHILISGAVGITTSSLAGNVYYVDYYYYRDIEN